MKDRFDIKRFWNYFRYDNRQMWRRNSKSLLAIAGMGLIFYVLSVVMGLVFNQAWAGPSKEVRLGIFVCASLGLMLFQTKSYGFITDKAAGSNWLMLPASRTEKFVSMMIITLIEMPLFFVGVYTALDALEVLLDPTVNGFMFSGGKGLSAIFTEMSRNGFDIGMSPAGFWFNSYVQLCANMLFCLLCGICFKRNKLVGAIGIMMLCAFLGSLAFSGILHIGHIQDILNSYSDNLAGGNTAYFEHLMNTALNIGLALNWVLAFAMGIAIYFRIKTIKH